MRDLLPRPPRVTVRAVALPPTVVRQHPFLRHPRLHAAITTREQTRPCGVKASCPGYLKTSPEALSGSRPHNRSILFRQAITWQPPLARGSGERSSYASSRARYRRHVPRSVGITEYNSISGHLEVFPKVPEEEPGNDSEATSRNQTGTEASHKTEDRSKVSSTQNRRGTNRATN